MHTTFLLPKRFFQRLISRSNEIHRHRKKPLHRYRKKSHQIESFFSFDHILIINTKYKAATTNSTTHLTIKYQLLIEPYELCESRILQIWGQSFIKLSKHHRLQLCHFFDKKVLDLFLVSTISISFIQ